MNDYGDFGNAFDDFDDVTVEQLLAGARPDDPAHGALVELRGFACAAPPAPSARLAELLAGGCAASGTGVTSIKPADAPRRPVRTDLAVAVLASLPAAELARRNQVGRLVAAAVLVGGTTLGLTGVAAAHDALPDPAQGVVRTVVNTVTNFHIDGPPRGHESSYPSRPGVVPPAAGRVHGAAPAPGRPRAAGSPARPGNPLGSAGSAGPGPVSPSSPAAGTQFAAATTPKQRTARGAALHARRVAARAALQQRLRERLRRQQRRHAQAAGASAGVVAGTSPGGSVQAPVTPPVFGLAAWPPVAASRWSHDRRPRLTSRLRRPEVADKVTPFVAGDRTQRRADRKADRRAARKTVRKADRTADCTADRTAEHADRVRARGSDVRRPRPGPGAPPRVVAAQERGLSSDL